MAKRVISEAYTFNKDTKIITVLGKVIRREQLILILNVRTNTVLFNFSDTSTTFNAYTSDGTPNAETTTITLGSGVDTSSMTNNDPLSIIVDETNETFQPAETYMDPVQKMRVSTPQSLIDTDFEYGTQPTKWETIALLNNRPSAFFDITNPIVPITSITPTGSGSRVVTVISGNTSVSNPFGPLLPVFIQETTNPDANGWFLPQTVGGSQGAWTFTYNANVGITPSSSIFDNTKTYIWVGSFFTSAGITVNTGSGLAFTNSGTVVTCTTVFAHGLSIGDGIFVIGTTATGNPPNGNWFVKTTPTTNTFTFDVINAPSGANITAANGSLTTMFARSLGFSQHRPFDGGVNFTAGTPFHGNQLIRQTRRYFRYQSGKGIQFSTGSNFCPLLFVDSVTNGGSGQTVTVTTKYPHYLGTGAVIVISGCNDSAYNGTFTIASTPSSTTFTYSCAPNTPTTAPALGWPINIGAKNWYGAAIRVGMFDSQNGFYFEYDGTTIYAVARRSTDQLSGTITTLANGSVIATGIGTRWARELIPGDSIVIRGMTYTAQAIQSDTVMTIYPEYRGTSIAAPSQVVVSKTVNTRYPQSSWNIDRANGTGISGFNLDITKMQMWYIDYAWYGAGAVRFGIKNQRGEVYYCHRIANANQRTEAYMRSGNLPARYEVNTNWPYTVLASTLNSGDTGMTVTSNVGFPDSGVLMVSACGTTSGGVSGVIEFVRYTGKSGTTVFTGLTRGVTDLTGPAGLTGGGGSVATTFTVSNPNTSPTQISLYSPQAGVTIGHWGSSVTMDGRYDDDKSIQFNFGMNTPITYATAQQRYPIMSIRLGPSVDNGITGTLGQREIINRMQLQPAGMGVYPTTSGVKVELIFNGRVTGGGTFAALGGSSLAQAVLHANTAIIAGGELIYTFFAPAGGVSTQDLSKIRDIGNSILGGGNTLAVPNTDNNKYPDGPDIITLCVTPLSANASVVARINWTEAQA